MDELLQEFIAETRETLAALASEIVAWEADPADRARLDAIFRFVHTVKGSCGFLDLPRLAKLSHEAENVLAAVRDGRRTPDRRLVDAVLAVVDRIGEVTEAIGAGVAVESEGDAALIAALSDKPAALPVVEAQPQPAPTPRAAQRSVRLPVDLLDRMMNGMSEMVLARNELARKLRDGAADPASDAALERLSLTVAEMRDTVSRTRMQAIEALFAALPRIVRDTASQLGKQVSLTIEGGDVEIDREMIEAMRDPLIHLVRNAIDHGIEDPERRAAVAKPATGRLTVTARQSGNTIVIEIADDGAGIDVDRLIAKHAAAHGQDPRHYARLSDRERLALVFEPGLSSRDEVSEVSGRGVGMDVVRANVEQIGGRIEIANAPGRGLTIVVHVPLTLSILPAIVLGVGDQRFAVARQSVEEIIAATGEAVRLDPLGDGYVATVRGLRMPLLDLGDVLALTDCCPERRAMLAIVGLPGGVFALAVDRVHDLEELVVKPAAPPIMGCGLFAGMALPDTGVPMLVLDPRGIASGAGISFPRRVDESEPAIEAKPGLEALLVRDLDGVCRAIPLAAVERIEEIDVAQIQASGGRLRLGADGAIVDVIARGTLPAEGIVAVIRLERSGGPAIAVAEPIEIITLDGDWAAAVDDSGLLGVALHGEQMLEVIDPGPAGLMRAPDDAPVCVLAGEARDWLTEFLSPALRRAGYRVAVEPPADGAAVTVVAMEADAIDVPPGGTLVRLGDRPDGPGVFRYDRAGVLAAVAKAAR